ncbi:hypothetical protein FRB95_007847 [Tulasnella sp. JGI-2019a]|nr:hypothetical protein FRB95_007847 [Tulasnella sp. JGI-2019a]
MSTEAVHRFGQKTFGPWGNHTSTIDWCEDNYSHWSLVAEFWNTASNIPFILLGIFGMLSTRRLIGIPLRARLRAALAHSFLTTIGVGSFIFHSTLLWHAQVILDELPMLWSASMALYLTTVGGAEKGSTRLKALMMAIPAGLSLLYLSYPNPVLHQVAYASMQGVTILHVTQLFKGLPKATAEQARVRNECKGHFYKAMAMCLLGFAIWNVDNIFCDQLTALRASHGEIVGGLTQGHAWWHLLMGLGASRAITAMTFLSQAASRPDNFEFGRFLGLPYVRTVSTRVSGSTHKEL